MTSGHFQSFFIFFFRPLDPKSEKKIPVNQLIKKFWPYVPMLCPFQMPLANKISFLIYKTMFSIATGVLWFSQEFSIKLKRVMPMSHDHGLDAGLATDTIRHHSWQSVLARSFPYCIRCHTL